MMFVWVFYLLFALSCISYSPSDPPSTLLVNFGGAVKYHNWVGSVGAHMAYAAMTGIGPGIFAAIVLLGWAMVLWTKGDEITQLPLRVIGGALLVVGRSAPFSTCSAERGPTVPPAGPAWAAWSASPWATSSPFTSNTERVVHHLRDTRHDRRPARRR